MKATIAIAGLCLVATALGACGSSSAPRQDYFKAEVVQNLTCETVNDNKAELQEALNRVSQPSASEVRALLDLNPGQPSESVKNALTNKLNECKVSDPQVEVVTKYGDRTRLPVVVGNGQVVNGDSTKEPETPPVASADLLQRCNKPAGWDQLVACVGNEQWYKDGINQMKPYTGYDWNDVEKWANTTVDGKALDARTIHVYNMEVSDTDARNGARELIGDDADALPIVRHGEFVNSRGLEEKKVFPFIDRKKQVRVSLSPLVFDGEGKVTGLRGDVGIFLDCLNIWGMPFAVAPSPDKPAVCPPGSGMAGSPVPSSGPKGCNPPTTTTPPPTCEKNCTPPPCEKDCIPLDHKIPTRIPGQGGTGTGDGGTILYPGGDGTVRHTASPTHEPPKANNPPVTQQPAPTKPPANPVPSATPAPPGTTQPPATGAPPSTSYPNPCAPPPGMTTCP